MSALKLYGVPLSQPFRSVAWTLLQRHVPFEVQLTVPGAASKIGSLHESFLSKTKGRTGQVPVLEYTDGSSLCISESPSILIHLSEVHHWNTPNKNDLYDQPGTARKALIDSYMHWHHRGTRELAQLARPLLRPDLKQERNEEHKRDALRVLESLETGWLQGDDVYIGGGENPSIADILAYEEVVQVTMTGLLEEVEDYPNVSTWMQHMSQLPYHEEAHVALKELGDLSIPNETPMARRLGAATKAGVAALKTAQESFSTQSSRL